MASCIFSFFALLSCLFPSGAGVSHDHDHFDFFHVSLLVFEKVMRRRKVEAKEGRRTCKMMVEMMFVGDEQQLPLNKPLVEAFTSAS